MKKTRRRIPAKRTPLKVECDVPLSDEKLEIAYLKMADLNYTVATECTNCGYEEQDVWFPKGQRVEEFFCPQCSTQSLVPIKE